MVGRERERTALDQAYERAAGERACHLFTVLGAAGVGKSRLVSEFLQRAGRARDRCPRSLPPLRRGNHLLAAARGRSDALRRGVPLDDPRAPRRRRERRADRRAARRGARPCREHRPDRRDFLGRPQAVRGPGSRTAARRGLRRPAMGRADVSRPRRAHRRLVAGRTDPPRLPGAARTARWAPALERWQVQRDLGPAGAPERGRVRRAGREPPGPGSVGRRGRGRE